LGGSLISTSFIEIGMANGKNHPQATLEAATLSKIFSSNKQIFHQRARKSWKPGTFWVLRMLNVLEL